MGMKVLPTGVLLAAVLLSAAAHGRDLAEDTLGGAAKGAVVGAIAGDAGKGAAAGAIGSALLGGVRRNR